MPVSILTSLMLWSALLAPAASSDQPRSMEVDRAGAQVIQTAPAIEIRSCPLSEPLSWSILDADTEEEETGDGESDVLVSDAAWMLLPHSCQGSVSAIRRDRGISSSPSRSPVLRC